MANFDPQQSTEAIQRLRDCYTLCLQCASECIESGDRGRALCTKLCELCADSCNLCVKCITAGSRKRSRFA
jgi:hypothetical protein